MSDSIKCAKAVAQGWIDGAYKSELEVKMVAEQYQIDFSWITEIYQYLKAEGSK